MREDLAAEIDGQWSYDVTTVGGWAVVKLRIVGERSYFTRAKHAYSPFTWLLGPSVLESIRYQARWSWHPWRDVS